MLTPHNVVSLITGSARGIGAATARLLASRKHHVVINYRTSEQEAYATARECQNLGAETLVFKADISQTAECQALVDATINKWGCIDNLINNAGITVFADYPDFEAQSIEVFNKIFNTNLHAAYFLATCVAQHMQRQGGGSIVNISSMAGITGIGSSIPYAVSKGALNTLTLSLAKALAPEIRVNAICPGVVASTWWKSRFKEESKLLIFQNKQMDASPIHKLITPEEVAKTVLYLLENDYITGEILKLNAGTHLGANAAPKKEQSAESKAKLKI